jgi:hypothetical protein
MFCAVKMNFSNLCYFSVMLSLKFRESYMPPATRSRVTTIICRRPRRMCFFTKNIYCGESRVELNLSDLESTHVLEFGLSIKGKLPVRKCRWVTLIYGGWPGDHNCKARRIQTMWVVLPFPALVKCLSSWRPTVWATTISHLHVDRGSMHVV